MIFPPQYQENVCCSVFRNSSWFSTYSEVDKNLRDTLYIFMVPGRNHILINLSRNNLMSTLPLLNPSSHTGHALIAQTVWTGSGFRPKVDLVIPPGK